MTHLRQSKFGFPMQPPKGGQGSFLTFKPTYGLHCGLSPSEVAPGFNVPIQPNVAMTFTAMARGSNWGIDKGSDRIIPRSGISSYASGSNSPIVGGQEFFDINGVPVVLAFSSDTTVLTQAATDTNFSYVSAINPIVPTGSNYFTGSAEAYDNAQNQKIAVWTNPLNFPKFAALSQSITSYSNFTGISSLLSKAADVVNFDSRLVWFSTVNTNPSLTTYPTRVLWSTRGAQTDYTLANGAGFQDITDMRGVGQRIISEEDRVVLFTDQEIWAGRKRQDSYVFDFYAIRRDLGCPYPKTIVKTPWGIAFVGKDYEVYLVSGDSVTPLGPESRNIFKSIDFPSRIRELLDGYTTNSTRNWALYDPYRHTYCLFVNAGTGGTDPETSLVYSFDNQSWWLWSYVYGNGTANNLTWGYSSNIGGATTARTRMLLYSSKGTGFYSSDDLRQDSGTTFEALWRSGNLGFPGPDWTSINEIWIRYDFPRTLNGGFISDCSGQLFYGIDSQPASRTTSPIGLSFTSNSNSMMLLPVRFEGPEPQIEISVSDGGAVRISEIVIQRTPSGRFYGGQ